MAQDIAAERDISPQEALLGLVRTAAARAAWTDTIIVAKLKKHIAAGGEHDDPPDALVPWLRQSRDERVVTMRTAKAAVDAGVMTALERRLDVEGELVASTLGAVLDALGLDQAQRIFALEVAQAKLLGEELPEPVAPSAPPAVEEPDPRAGMERKLRDLTADEDVDVDALLAEVDDEEEGRDG
jgi:hypothetical protein